MIVSVLIGQLNAIVFNFAQPASHVEYHTTLTGIVVRYTVKSRLTGPLGGKQFGQVNRGTINID